MIGQVFHNSVMFSTLYGDGYSYGFNGMEREDEHSQGKYDFGTRIYDSRLGKFMSIDPYHQKYSFLSPYQFASNTPIQAIDLDGLEAWVVTWASQSQDKNGHNRIGHTGIVVKNYKQVQKQITVAALEWNSSTGQFDVVDKTVTVTTYEPTGSYTYYDFWPMGTDLTGKEAIQDVKSAPTVQEFGKGTVVIKDDAALEKWLKNHDVSQIETIEAGRNEQSGYPALGSAEGNPADGVVKIDLTGEESYRLAEKFKDLAANSTVYNGLTMNCTSFVCEGLTEVNISLKPEVIIDWRNIVEFSFTTESFTPNNTYKQLSKRTDVKIIRDATHETQESYEDAVLDAR